MAYPSSLDELTDGVPSDGAAPTTDLGDATYPHDDHHRALATAVEAVEAELGLAPSGASATVVARLDALDATVAAAGLDAPWHQTVDVRAVPFAQTNMSTLTTLSGTALYPYARIDSGTAGAASISYKFPMSAGTYSIEIVAYADTYMPIVTAKIDGTTVGTVDFYKTGGIAQREGAITGITVATSGTKTINLTNATKNASSSGYTFYLMALRILRTA